MESRIGLIIQFTGVFLITVLMLFLHRSLRTTASKYWTYGWAALSLALFALSFAFSYPEIAKALFGIYFFAEYLFGVMLILGCLGLSEHYRADGSTKWAVVALASFAFFLPLTADRFDLLFRFHAFLLGTFFAVAFYALKKTEFRSFGWRVMRVALMLLALDFYHYVVVYSLPTGVFDPAWVQSYLTFIPIFDLVLEILLGFGMVIVSLEKVLQQVQTVNEKLEDAHRKLEHIAHIDPLTTAFNRHAFYGYLKKSGEEQEKAASGCVGFFDIDDLKPINDELGHTVGDAVIRAVAGAIRDLIRAEDLIYRWGGDEFFVIMLNVNAEMARERMNELAVRLTDVNIDGAEEPMTISVSFGFTDFSDVSELEKAVKGADEEMYRRKQSSKRAQQNPPFFRPEGKAASSLRA